MMSVLYHTRDEVSTFWILSSLVENYELRQFYQRGMPGIAIYGEVLASLIEQYLPQLGEVLRRHQITYFDFFETWASSLFTNEVPVDLTLQIVASFLKDGWAFFFRVCLTVLSCLQR